MKYAIVMMFVLPGIYAQTTSSETLYAVLEEMLDESDSDIQFLAETFPIGAIDFANLQADDLHALFFLTPEEKQQLWANKTRIQSQDDLAAIISHQGKAQLLRICWQERAVKPSHFAYVRLRDKSAITGVDLLPYTKSKRIASMLRYQFKWHRYSFGINLNKDSGESNAADGVNAFATYTDKRITVGLGRAYWRSGLGIVAGTSQFAARKVPFIAARVPQIKGYSGSDEFLPNSGAWVGFNGGNHFANLFFGQTTFDARPDNDGVRILTDGYHRTVSEVAAKNQLQNRSLFWSYMYSSGNLALGQTGLLSAFAQTPVTHSRQIYRDVTVHSSLLGWAKSEKFKASFDFQIYPSFSGVITAQWQQKNTGLYLCVYSYGDNHSLRSRHLFFNKHPHQTNGINIKWKFRSDKWSSATWLLYDKDRSDNTIRQYAGLKLHAKSGLELMIENQMKTAKEVSEGRWDVKLTKRRSLKKGIKQIMQIGVASDHRLNTLQSYFISQRLRFKWFAIVTSDVNIGYWSNKDGYINWLYEDDLPFYFSSTVASKSGFLWGITNAIVVNEQLNIFYKFGYNTVFEADKRGTGLLETAGPSQNTHHLGLTFKY
jgi:hypothetical protein